ncbi:MAG TPA: Rne/Rng family ribonuclease [Sedimentisphaerales bacterium]|nr:Rne/Rng family ribonuclease [Sedimentisphaerales bacterium]
MAREMLINVAESEECRVAVVENGSLEELYIERASLGSRVGNIYKGRVVNVESGIQAAFVDFGIGRNGFLHISDLHHRYFAKGTGEEVESVGRRKSLKQRPPIQNCLHKGDELVVQVTKEGIKTKGPTLSTYLAVAGKYLVMLPWMRKHGVSHKIEDDDERERLRKILEEIKPPRTMGFIIRTAGQGCSKRDIQNDFKYLMRLWTAIKKRLETEKSPAELYQESNLVIRTLRDVFNTEISEIICDSESVVRKIRDFLSIASPRLRKKVTYCDAKVPLFHKYGIEGEITRIQSRAVDLKAGGSIVIEQTEALVSIDVNSGRYRKQQSAEQTAYKINIEAASEIARQLRLRDLGGLIICDFIDMRSEKHRREVEKGFRAAMKADRARSRILRMSQFGIVEMTRQRMRPSLQSSTHLSCPHCGGTGFVKNHESLAIEIIRLLNLSASRDEIKRIELFVSPEVTDYLQNEKRTAIAHIEQLSEKRVIIHSAPSYTGEKYDLVCYDERGSTVKL